MVKLISYLLLFTTLILFGQNQTSPKDQIYNAVDNFVANPNEKDLQKLSLVQSQFWGNPKLKTKEELLAIVILNCNKAFYENKFDRKQEAIRSYEKAWEIYQKNKLANYDISEYCLKPLGNLYTLLGDCDNAENTIKQYYFIATKEKNTTQKNAAVLNLSNVYQSCGKIDLAIDLLEKTLRTEKLSNTQKGIVLNNLGTNYLLKTQEKEASNSYLKKAKRTFETALNYLKKEPKQLESTSNTYRNLATVLRKEQDYAQAELHLKKARELFLEMPIRPKRELAKLNYEYALLLFDEEKYSEASAIISAVFKTLIPYYAESKEILPNQSSLFAETVLLDALDLQASIFIKQNQANKALEAYNLSFQIEDLFMNLLIYENSKIITLNRVRNRTEKCIEIYNFLYKKELDSGYLESAFELSEKTKSAVLKSFLNQNKTASREEKLHLQQLQDWTNEILKEQQKGDSADLSKINKDIQKQNELMLSLKKIKTKSKDAKPESIDVNSLYTQLENDKAFMISYFSGTERMYYFTLEDHQIKLNSFSNTAKSIDKVWKFINYFNESGTILNDIKGYNKSSKTVYDLLQFPTEPKHKNLILIPDGVLNFLPFEALITKESSTTNFAKMDYLVKKFTIIYNSSASFYNNEKLIPRTKRNILGIFPVFEKTKYTLSFSKKEMESLKDNFDGRYLENEKANFENFKKNSILYSILHLSTHASSGDRDTPASIKFYDREVLYSELYHLNMSPDLVVLSACETGIGKLYKSEGAMSIARGFQFAGAKNLLFSLWKVNDYTTSVFMEEFYSNIKNDEPYFEANKNANWLS
jgi:CHAT domain-containing protein